MSAPFFGVQYVQIDNDALPPVLSDFSIGAIVSYSNDATASVFPLNTPVAVNSADTSTLAALGTGLLYKAVLRINAQLADFESSARLVIVRVLAVYEQDGVTVDQDATMANILGSASAGTGLYALLKAPQLTQATPRLIIVPGFTGQTKYGVANPVVTAEGQGYTNPVVTFNPPGATATATVGNAGATATAHATLTPGAQATAHATLGSGGTAGQVASIAVDTGGTLYGSAPAVTLTGGGGTGAAAHAVLTAGVVSSIVVDNAGSGYTSAPTVTVAAPAGGKVSTITVDTGGNTYGSTAPAVTLTGGGGTGATAHAVLTAGVVSSIVVDNAGLGYTSAPTVAVAAPPGGQVTSLSLTNPGDYAPGTSVTVTIADSQGGSGTGAAATISLEQLANPVCAILPTIASGLLAHALVSGPGGTVQDAQAWRVTLPAEERLIPQDDWEIIENLAGNGTEYIDGACRSLGLAIRTDFQNGGYPFHAWANQPIVGALGVKRPDGFSLTDGATDGQVLLAAGIGITARGDAADTSIDDSGYVAISVSNASSDTLYNLYNKTRGDDFINLALLKSIRKRLGKNNITRKGVDAVLNDMTAVNQTIMSLDDPGIIGFKVKFNAADNTVAGLRAGKFTVENDAEVPAPIIQITINRGLDADAETALLQQLASDGTSGTAS